MFGTLSWQFVREVIILSILSSVIWVCAGFLTTMIFGGILSEYFFRLLSHKRLLKRTLVVPPVEKLKEISKEPDKVDTRPMTTLKIFVFIFLMNFVYTLFLSNKGIITRGGGPIQTFTQIQVIASIIFLPLITLVIPISLGKIKIRQVDNSPVDSYWLWTVIAITGGVGMVLLMLQRSAVIQLVPQFFLYAVCSWYAALGALFALPVAEKMLVKRLLKMRGNEKIIFGKMWAGGSKEKAREV
jgi:hypothetical protein